MVGTVGHKDSLPHHRYGSPAVGGDEYPADGNTTLAGLASRLHERVQRTTPDTPLGSALRAAYKVFRRLIRRWTPVVEGAWHGNDTTWRMGVDVARAAVYADAAGTLHESPQRTHLVLTDGIIGGEGEGPYHSSAIHGGILTLSDDLSAADHVNALLMGYNPERIPMVRESARLDRYPLLTHDLHNATAVVNGRSASMAELARMPVTRFEPHEGWKKVLDAP